MNINIRLCATALGATLPLACSLASADGRDYMVVVIGDRILDSRSEIAGRLGLPNRETRAIVDVVTQEDVFAIERLVLRCVRVTREGWASRSDTSGC